MSSIINAIIAYNIIKDMSTPFDKTNAFKLGVIDKNGKILVPKSERTREQNQSIPSLLTVLAWNLKKILSKVGIGRSTIASFTSAILLLREELKKQEIDPSVEKTLIQHIKQEYFHEDDKSSLINEIFLSYFLQNKKLSYIQESVEEELGGPISPTNSVGAKMVAGINPGEDPPIRVKKNKPKVGLLFQKKFRRETTTEEYLDKYKVFDLDGEHYSKCSRLKRKFERWDKFFETDYQIGNQIRNFSIRNPHKGIILRNSETGETMVFRRKWEDQRLFHNRKMKMLANSKEEEFRKNWMPWQERVKS
jgi:hypothetical protein